MRRWSALAFAAVVAIAVPGCGDTGAEPGVETGASQGEITSYQVRGVVRAIGERSLHIRHEAIPDFRDANGAVVGMEAMSMDFYLSPEVSTDGLEPGDEVSFELTVDWDAEQPAQITALTALAPSTSASAGVGEWGMSRVTSSRVTFSPADSPPWGIAARCRWAGRRAGR